MSKIVQFFSEFYHIPVNYIEQLDQNIQQEQLYSLTSHDISDIVPETYISKYNIETCKEQMRKLEEINAKNDIKFISILDEEYPTNLKNIDYPPKILYYKGDISLLKKEKNIAVVGSRKPTTYGKWATSSLVKDLVDKDFCISSGFAGGIDTISHSTAIKNKGKTICVFATSVDKIYPTQNRYLYQEVLDGNNLIISENNSLKPAQKKNFALRNRIVSGISKGVLITEAGSKSGTLITAKYALEQGKYVFAVPGNINSPNSYGANALIKDGACMVTNIGDILFEMRYEDKYTNQEINQVMNIDDLSDIEKQVYMIIKLENICHSEKIAIALNMNIQDVISILNVLDLKGYIIYDGFMASYKTI